jgi:hypothetical protein
MIKLFNWFKKDRRIAFIDGDQPLNQVINSYNKHVKGTKTETHFIKAGGFDSKPKLLKKYPEINEVYLNGFTHGKEITDKYIATFINKAINDGFNHLTVISSDYDFIDIFKMAVILDEKNLNLTFRMIMPAAKGRARHLPHKLANIEIIRN